MAGRSRPGPARASLGRPEQGLAVRPAAGANDCQPRLAEQSGGQPGIQICGPDLGQDGQGTLEGLAQ